jgi:hypothetical protein
MTESGLHSGHETKPEEKKKTKKWPDLAVISWPTRGQKTNEQKSAQIWAGKARRAENEADTRAWAAATGNKKLKEKSGLEISLAR